MIDPDDPKPISFRRDDVPELPELPALDREEERRRSAAVAEQMARDMGFQPIGVEW